MSDKSEIIRQVSARKYLVTYLFYLHIIVHIHCYLQHPNNKVSSLPCFILNMKKFSILLYRSCLNLYVWRQIVQIFSVYNIASCTLKKLLAKSLLYRINLLQSNSVMLLVKNSQLPDKIEILSSCMCRIPHVKRIKLSLDYIIFLQCVLSSYASTKLSTLWIISITKENLLVTA